MSFGFDPSIILGATKVNEPTLNDTLRTLADLRQSRTADQHNQAQLSDMLRKQGQEQTLADIYKANAGTGTGLAPDLMRAGLGQQAMAWQDQEAQMAAKKAQGAKAKQELESAYRKHIGERVQDVKDQASLDTVREEFASSGDPFLSAYVSKIPEKYDPVTIAPIKNQAISAEKRSDIEQKGLDRTAAEKRANIMANARPQMLVTGDDGTQHLQNPSRPNAPATTIRDENGNPIRKPAGSGGAASPKEWKEFSSLLSTGARGSLNKDLQRSINSAEALETLLKLPDGRFAEATPQQMHEAYTALNNLISKGGSQAASQIEALVPETLASKWANVKQKVLNEPQSADAKAFIENILDTTSREVKLAQKQLRRQQFQSIPNYAHLRGADKKRFDSILKGVGIDPSTVDETGLEAAAADTGLTKEERAELQQLESKFGGKK